METKIVTKKKQILIIVFLLFMGSYSNAQSGKIYFLINKNDTLIQKQTATKNNSFEGYLIIDENRIKPLKTTPSEEGKVWVPESDDDFYTFGPWFSFNSKNDTFISRDFLQSLKIIRSRKRFLKLKDNCLSGAKFFFIEPIEDSNKYILREVFPVTLE